jgi:hypothetical protein
VIRKHGESKTPENINHLAIEVHDKEDRYTIENAAIDIKNKYFPDAKPSKEASYKLVSALKGGNGTSPEIKQKFEEDYLDVDLDDLCSRIQTYRQNGNNGNLKPIDDINEMSFGFVSSDEGKPWQNNRGPVKAMLEIMVKCDNNGGVPA